MSLRALVRLAFVVSTVSIGVLRAQDSGWILTNVQIVDLERGRVLDARTLHIRDDRIAAIVESPTARQVAGLRTIHGQGSFVIPGLFDMHVHLVTDGPEPRRRPRCSTSRIERCLPGSIRVFSAFGTWRFRLTHRRTCEARTRRKWRRVNRPAHLGCRAGAECALNVVCPDSRAGADRSAVTASLIRLRPRAGRPLRFTTGCLARPTRRSRRRRERGGCLSSDTFLRWSRLRTSSRSVNEASNTWAA